jgi:hypothetical protein
MKIKILQQTKRGISFFRINRKSLKNYVPFSKSGERRVVWVKPEYYKTILSKVRKLRKILSPKVRYDKGKTELTGKKYIRFRFSLWRNSLVDIDKIKSLFLKLIQKYDLVKKQGKKFPTQRIGITIASKEREYNEYVNSKTKRKNTRELIDFISTSTYANNEKSTAGMFEDLLDKVIKSFLKTNKSPSLLDDDSTRAVKDFFVFFVEA